MAPQHSLIRLRRPPYTRSSLSLHGANPSTLVPPATCGVQPNFRLTDQDTGTVFVLQGDPAASPSTWTWVVSS